MLVLTRKAGEELVIDDNIRVIVNRIAGNRVAIGLVAPDEVRIVRGELQETVNSFESKEAESADAVVAELEMDPAIASPRQAR